jgi:hypothetical protein
MGLMDRMKSAGEKASAATSKFGVGASAEQIKQANLAQKLATSGVEAQAHIDSMTATGNTDATNSVEYDFELTVTSAAGESYKATTRQYVHPAAADSFVEGAGVTVKVDPDDPSALMLFGPGKG